MDFFIKYLITINIITFIAFGLDKYYAINNKYRISEKTLFSLCLLGGSFFGYIAMKVFRHKTKKLYFVIGIPLIAIIEVLIFIYYQFIL